MALTNAEHNSDTPIILEDVARTADANSEDYNSRGRRGIILYLDVDSITGAAPTLDVKLQAKSPNGDYVDVPGAAFAQVSAAGTAALVVYPGVAETANVSVSDVLPRVFRVVTDVNVGASFTDWNGSVTAHLIP